MADAQGRKLIEVNIPGETFSLKEFDYGTLDAAIAFLTRLRDQYQGKELTLSVHQEPYSDHEYYQVREKRRETDEEMAERLENERVTQQQREARERAEYARLSKQFGPKP